jgi:branched-chain amino acid transport system permease protein
MNTIPTSQKSVVVLVAALAVGFLILPYFVGNAYALRVWMLLLIYAIIGLGLNVLVGLTELVSLGQAGIFAVGAYASGILSTRAGFGFPESVLSATAIAGACGALLAYPTMRVRGVYLAVITIAFGIVVQNVAIEWQSVTGGTMGISNIPQAALFGMTLSDTAFYYLMVFVLLLVFVAHHNLIRSRFGRAMRAVAQSEIAARATGINPIVIRTTAFVFAALAAGMAGSLYAYLNLYVNPDTFTFDDSLHFLLIVILGGSGTITGPLIGAAVLTALPEYFQAFGAWQHFAYGALLALVMFLMPLGVTGTINHWRERWRKPAKRVEGTGAHKPTADALPLERLTSSCAPSTACLKTSGLSIRFGGLLANDSISETLKSGTIHAVIGPNGAGKSTFLNCISGFYQPTSGTIEFFGTPITGKSSHELARMGLARTFQNTELFGKMSALDNVLIGFNQQFKSGLLDAICRTPAFKRDEAHFRTQALALLDYVGLSGFATEMASNLPFGYQRRLEIARALALSPRLLLLDEPAAGLTHSEIEELSELIRGLAGRGMTMILVEHHVDMVMSISDHVTVLDYGKVIASGTVADIQRDPKVLGAYLGTSDTYASASDTTTVQEATR